MLLSNWGLSFEFLCCLRTPGLRKDIRRHIRQSYSHYIILGEVQGASRIKVSKSEAIVLSTLMNLLVPRQPYIPHPLPL